MTHAPIRLSTLLGTYPKTAALKSGAVKVEGAELDIAPIDEAMQGFKAAMRDLKYDVCELALSTFLQARSVNKPFVLLPFVMNGKFHHGSVLRRADDPYSAYEMNGRRVAIRSWSQTTPTWVRGFLMDDFGMKIDQVKWMVQIDSHVAEVPDPAWVQRIPAGKNLLQALIDGEVDAVLSSQIPPGEKRVVTVLEDPKAAGLAWGDKYNAVPINHLVVMRRELADSRPDLVRAVYKALIASRLAAEPPPKPGERVLQPYGFAGVQRALEIGSRYAVDQGLIPKAIPLDELYGSVRESLAGIA